MALMCVPHCDAMAAFAAADSCVAQSSEHMRATIAPDSILLRKVSSAAEAEASVPVGNRATDVWPV